MNPDNPLIIQSDYSILVEINSPRYTEVQLPLQQFAELIKSPEHIHTYKLSPLSVWNARSSGMTTDAIIETLTEFAKYPVSDDIINDIRDFSSRYGKIKIYSESNTLLLDSGDHFLAQELLSNNVMVPLLTPVSDTVFQLNKQDRGRIKQLLITIGYPAEDLAGYTQGSLFKISLKESDRFSLRDYQRDAVDKFYKKGNVSGGAGVLVLPCGAGKTIIGIAAMAEISSSTLILTTSVTSVRQWIAEICDKTTVNPEDVVQYSSKTKRMAPITVATYQMLTHKKDNKLPHMALFDAKNWGFIIYDEVHTLPAPVFQITASLQSKRRLGLTATLIREDGKEEDVFTLIGPKKADVPWKSLEKQGWIAKAHCVELRIPFSDDDRLAYAIADKRRKFRVAAENKHKFSIVKQLLETHKNEPTIIIGLYITQLQAIAKALGVPVLSGSTPQSKRDRIFDEFCKKKIKTLIVSKIANFAVDLPDASVAIQISGTFGSRQEEAQRLGRLLRPKRGSNNAFFYSLVTQDTTEQDFARNRQLFLCEQGYTYKIVDTVVTV